MRRIIIPSIAIIICTVLSCSISETTPTFENFLFEDGFEVQEGSFDDLFPANGQRWSTIQVTNPSSTTNDINLSDLEVNDGLHSLYILAQQSDEDLSKSDIEKNGLVIGPGSTVTIAADFYIMGTESLENLLLIDLECCSCWDPTVGDNFGAENQCPGVRLMMSGGNDYLSIERGKISGSTIQQTTFPFPRNQWVSVQWHMTLADDDQGTNRLVINGNEVINEFGMNMPNPQIFADAFQTEGIDFVLQVPTYYERVQIGATANPTASRVEMFVDNFSIEVVQ